MTWFLAGLCLILTCYSVAAHRRIRSLRLSIRTLRRQLTSARTTKDMVQEARTRLERTLSDLAQDRDELRELLTAKAGHVFDRSDIDGDARAYLDRMAGYDKKAGTP